MSQQTPTRKRALEAYAPAEAEGWGPTVVDWNEAPREPSALTMLSAWCTKLPDELGECPETALSSREYRHALGKWCDQKLVDKGDFVAAMRRHGYYVDCGNTRAVWAIEAFFPDPEDYGRARGVLEATWDEARKRKTHLRFVTLNLATRAAAHAPRIQRYIVVRWLLSPQFRKDVGLAGVETRGRLLFLKFADGLKSSCKSERLVSWDMRARKIHFSEMYMPRDAYPSRVEIERLDQYEALLARANRALVALARAPARMNAGVFAAAVTRRAEQIREGPLPPLPKWMQ